MNRSALLLYSLSGDSARDAFSALASLLRSDVGGAWGPGELQILEGGSADQVREAIARARGADYFLGYIFAACMLRRGPRPWPQLILRCGGEEFDESALNPGCPRCALIVDVHSGSADTVGLQFPTAKNPDGARAVFEQALAQAEQGWVRAYPDAGYLSGSRGYTAEVLQRVAEWDARNSGVFSLDSAFKGVAGAVYEGGRRMRHFPFAVKG